MTGVPEGPWRVGNHCGKNLYVEDGRDRGVDVGRMDSADLAAYVVECVTLRQRLDQQLSGAVDRLTDPLRPDRPADLLARQRSALCSWASAADTVVEHESEAAARVYEDVCSVLHRWPDGPWLRDDGKIWDGDPALADLQAKLFAEEAEVRRLRALLHGKIVVTEMHHPDFPPGESETPGDPHG